MEGVDARFWLEVVRWAFTLGIGIAVWFVSRQKATTAQIDQARKSADEGLADHSDRLIRLEASMEHMPTNAAIHGLNEKLSELHGDFKRMDGWMEGIKGSLGTLENNVRQLVENELRERKK